MSDMVPTITPKSDQINYDDFIGVKNKIIKITHVKVGEGEQKVSIFYEGDNGKPYKPCKSMCRVLVHCWGSDSKNYSGKLIELYGDPEVKWAGMKVGGIRISRLSGIRERQLIQLTASKGKRAPFIVDPIPETTNKRSEKDMTLIAEITKLCADQTKGMNQADKTAFINKYIGAKWSDLNDLITENLEKVKTNLEANRAAVKAEAAEPNPITDIINAVDWGK